MIRFIHTADIHFGMENYGRVDARSGIHSRLLDFEKALSFCVDHAIKEQIDFFLFSGDAYKTANPTPTHQRLFMRCLLRLYKAGIPIVMVVGNHDNPLSFGKAHALEIFDQVPLDGFHVIAKPEVIVLTTKQGPVQIVGIPWPTRNLIALHNQKATAEQLTQHISQTVSLFIEETAQKLNQDIPAVLAGHLTVSSGIFSGSEKRAVYGTDPIFLPSQLAIKPFDYVALGHLHRYQNLNAGGYPAVVYSGSIERIDFGERKEEKGFCLVTLKDKQTTHIDFIKTPTRPFIQIEITLSANENHTEQLLQAIGRHDIHQAIVKIVYHVPTDIRDTVDIQTIQKACTFAWFLVGIFPVRKPVIRQRRAAVKVNMSLDNLLNLYFQQKPELQPQKEKLIQLAHDLQDHLNSENN